jgi:hypothetical protein
VDEGRFEVSEASRRNHRIYYRVRADGVELPSLVCIFESQQHAGFEEELRMWCKNNADRLESGAILEASL